jgi:hypothetical protein
VGGDIAWTYRCPRSDETSAGPLCVGQEATDDSELFRMIGRHQHGSMLSYRLLKSPIVLSRRPDPLVDLLQGIPPMVAELFQHVPIETHSQFHFMQGIEIVSNWVLPISVVATLCPSGRFWATENLPILPLDMPKRGP